MYIISRKQNGKDCILDIFNKFSIADASCQPYLISDKELAEQYAKMYAAKLLEVSSCDFYPANYNSNSKYLFALRWDAIRYRLKSKRRQKQ